jgi:hypothetical protein
MEHCMNGSARAKRAVTICALILLLSLGLCGANMVVFRVFGLAFSGGPAPGPHGALKDTAGLWFTFAAILEVLGMFVGGIGLAISLAAWLATSTMEKSSRD